MALFLWPRFPGRAALVSSASRALPVLFVALASVGFAAVNYLNPSAQFVRAIVCLDRASGAIRWTCKALPGPAPLIHRANSPATPTPAIADGRIVAYFGTPGMICADLQGNLIWENRNLPYDSMYGAAASPIIRDGIVALVCDMPESPYIAALDLASGRELWRYAGRPECPYSKSGNSRTPIVKEWRGQPVLLAWGWDALEAYDLHTGNRMAGYLLGPQSGSDDKVASLISDGDRLFLAGPGKTCCLSFSRLMEQPVTPHSPLLWETDIDGANCASPVFAENMIFMVSDAGRAACLDSATGAILWQERLKGPHASSLVAAAGFVYFTSQKGATTVVAAAPQFKILAANSLPGEINASPALSAGVLYIRTDEALCAIKPAKNLRSSCKTCVFS
ncbi:MAG: outer membrane biogenesis protein BamB [candidate division BRC1 bacterium ADurb.BinA364]|nr:MAG: outer membrane biogenesis protein BamB [candidate division BRC1 bacterium ADurb.BinA364]